MDKPMNIYEKLLKIKKSVDYLQKDNKGFQYNYVSSAQTLASIRIEMNNVGVLLIPQVTAHKWTDIIRAKNAKGNDTVDIFTEMDITYRWVNCEKPDEFVDCTWYGQGMDTSGEKGVGKALTYAEKYFILKFFNIPTDKDDPDAFQDKFGGVDHKEVVLISNQQLSALTEIIDNHPKKKTVHDWFLKTMKVASLDKIPVSDYESGLKKLQDAIKPKEVKKDEVKK